jgi:hypothetical protein
MNTLSRKAINKINKKIEQWKEALIYLSLVLMALYCIIIVIITIYYWW